MSVDARSEHLCAAAADGRVPARGTSLPRRLGGPFVLAIAALLTLPLVAVAPAQYPDSAGAARGRGQRPGHRLAGPRPGMGHRSPGYPAPGYETSWFQRPYPYHLDYYRMRYGGSYAPYFGNLYGPPVYYQVPPYAAFPFGAGFGGAYYW